MTPLSPTRHELEGRRELLLQSLSTRMHELDSHRRSFSEASSALRRRIASYATFAALLGTAGNAASYIYFRRRMKAIDASSRRLTVGVAGAGILAAMALTAAVISRRRPLSPRSPLSARR